MWFGRFVLFLVVPAVVCLLLLMSASPSLAWTEYNLTPEFWDAYSSPAVAVGTDGKVHIVFGAIPDGQTLPRFYYKTITNNAPSAAVDLPGPNYKEQEPAIAIDGNNVVHIVGRYRPDGTAATPYTVYYWSYNGSTWTGPTQISLGSDTNTAKIAIDRFNDVHVVWSEQGGVGGGGEILYKKKQAGVWQAAQWVTNNWGIYPYGGIYPDIAIDKTGNNIHVVWHDEDSPTEQKRAFYTKNTNMGAFGHWLGHDQWTMLSEVLYGANPFVCLDNSDNPNCVWVGLTALEGGNKYSGYRRWTGSAWTAIQNFGWWLWPQDCEFGAGNVFRYIYLNDQLTGKPELYSQTYDFANLSSPAELVSVGGDTRKVYNANMAYHAPTGVFHVTWMERKEPDGTAYVFYGSSGPSNQAPGPVTSFSVDYVSDGKVGLRWTNPTSVSFQGTMIRFSTTGYPTSHLDGQEVCNKAAMAGSTDTCVHEGLTNGVTYYYTAFAHDNTPLYAAGVNVQAAPRLLTCAYAKSTTDTTHTELPGKVVTALFPSDGCFYVSEPNRTSGLRVAGSLTGLSVGDTVDVMGTMGTRLLSGQPAERQVAATETTQITTPPTNTPLTPLAMNCKAVGGAAVGLAPGVRNASGANNMGLLVKLAGKVTRTIGTYLYIDDGTGIPDSSGYSSVMVKCPADPTQPPKSLALGDIVSVVGIVEGSIPAGWTSNRRYLHIRDWNDVTLISRP